MGDAMTATRRAFPSDFLWGAATSPYQIEGALITENGMAHEDRLDADGRIRDSYRVDYLAAHLEEVGRALADGANVRGYCCWSLLDNLEWDMGWGQRFGLIHVDNQTLKRTVKDSGWWYRDWIAKIR